jgi:curli biogenesis system outer membrane secretion channel CsgG
MRERIVFFIVAGILLSDCAYMGPSTPSTTAQLREFEKISQTSADTGENTKVEENEVPIFPPYEGPKRNIQVVEISVPKEDIERYPELSDKQVGFGLASILLDVLFKTDRFEFLEEKEEILRRILEQWKATKRGIYVTDSPTRFGMRPPEFLVYAKVFDFVACSPAEEIHLTRKKLTCVTTVGVQVRIVKTATGELIPGSTNPLSDQGTYFHTRDLSIFGGPLTAFDQSAVGKATWRATHYAVLQVLKRFDQKRW